MIKPLPLRLKPPDKKLLVSCLVAFSDEVETLHSRIRSMLTSIQKPKMDSSFRKETELALCPCGERALNGIRGTSRAKRGRMD
jgi:hypothetical protein